MASSKQASPLRGGDSESTELGPFHTESSRGKPRLSCRLPLSLRDTDNPASQVIGLGCDLSLSGLGARTTRPVPPGTRVMVDFGEAGGNVHVPAVVVWARLSRQVTCLGMRFDLQQSPDGQKVHDLVRRVRGD